MKNQFRVKSTPPCVLGVLLFFLMTGFRAGSVKVDITPDTPQWLLGYFARKSTSVNDRIYHRVVVMEDDGGHQFALISSDLCAISVPTYEALCKQLEKETGLRQSQVWWTVTHTHSAPEVGSFSMAQAFMPERFTHEPDQAYTQKVLDLLIDGVKKAQQGLTPARIGVGTGISFANMNRRAIDVDGKVTLGLNPDGPVDRQIGLLRIEHLDGAPIALVASYAMHGTAMSAHNLAVSGDALGIVAEYVEEKLGAPMLYINGAAGDITSLYYFHPNPRAAHLRQFRVMLGNRIIEANQSIRTDNGSAVRFWTGQVTVETPKREKLIWPDDHARHFRKTGEDAGMVRIPIQFLKINEETLIWSAPLELFCEVALKIRAHSPFPNTFYYGYTNGWLGYLPTAKAFEHGGYETRTTPFTPRAEEDMTKTIVQYLHGIVRVPTSAAVR
ncbi:MAG: neutral/alkaline non-lysosomal ceramidase N-terminal domain-containing protein [Acidobacteriota bacterium]